MNKQFLVLFTLLLLPALMLSGCSGPASSLEALVSGAALARADTVAAAPAAVPTTSSATAAPAAAQPVSSVVQPAASAAQPAPSAGTLLDVLEAVLGQIYDRVTPSVVNIQVVQGAAALPSAIPEMPGLPSDPSLPEGPFRQEGLGSGFVWDKEGHIVTNNHVVAGAEEITVTFYDDTTIPGEVVGTDPHSDLAVIKVDLPASQLYPVQVADSTQVRAGQLAVAIGNPFGLEGTMTVGFISALGRSLPVASGTALGPSYTIPDIIQTDAPINPGNSGGVLVDDQGQVIGVPTAIESPVRANAGIGFAVPSVIVQKVVPALIKDGHYEHPWLGVSGTSLTAKLAEAMDLNAGQRGVLVSEVIEGGPADKAGLQGSDRQVKLNDIDIQVGGDVIVAIDDQPVLEFDDLVTYLIRSTNAGQTVTLTILRDGAQGGSEETVQVTLTARPQQEERQQTQAQPGNVPVGGAWLGIRGMTVIPEVAEAMDLDSDQQGVLVTEVVQDSPANEAGLLGGQESIDINGQSVQVGGDIIVAADDQPVAGMEDLLAFLQGSAPDQEVTLTLVRDGQEVTADVTLGERPSSMP